MFMLTSKHFPIAAALLSCATACGKDESVGVTDGIPTAVPTVAATPVLQPSAQPTAQPPATAMPGVAPTQTPAPVTPTPVETAPVGTAPADTTPAQPSSAPVPPSPAPAEPEPEEELPQGFQLFGAPLIFNPTTSGFGINAIFARPDGRELRAYVSLAGESQWGEVTESSYPALDVIEWSVRGLEPGTSYDYAIMAVPPGAEGLAPISSPSDSPETAPEDVSADGGPADAAAASALGASASSADGGRPMQDGATAEPTDGGGAAGDAGTEPSSVDGLPGEPMYRGTVTTQRPPGQAYSFALVTDTHVPPRELPPGSLETTNTMESVLLPISDQILAESPDFLVNLGDMLDFHLFGFNAPPPDGSWTRLAYLNYRRLLKDALGNAPHFPVIGNWDGENGDFTSEQIAYSREQRLRYLPAPEPDTYALGGNVDEDYYAFTWGDATFITLNVMTYTPTSHLLGNFPGVADDWTLGEDQLAWLVETLEQVETKWRFILIHHVVGGAAGDDVNSAYGRGGGQAAYVGEQALVHELMLEHNVQIFFYGHDHVFTDMTVDGIHYTLPGSAGAPWKFESVETGYEQYWIDSGYARVDVSPERVGVEFISMTGESLYAYEIEE